MSTNLWKVRESTRFGNWTLIKFLERHGAEMGTKSVLSVPASAFKAALANPEEAGLDDEDIAFIKSELADMGIDPDIKPDQEENCCTGEDDDEDGEVDVYDIW